MTSLLRTILLTLGAAAVLVAGCQSEAAKIEPPQPENPPSTPSPEQPKLPTKAKRDDYAGAVAFVEHYYKLAEYGEQTRNWKPLRAASTSDCDGCTTFWQGSLDRDLDYDDVMTNSPSINNLIDGVARVNVIADDLHRKKMNGDLRLTWVDVVSCTYVDGHWQVVSLESKTS